MGASLGIAAGAGGTGVPTTGLPAARMRRALSYA